jgi:hypothetical protein
MTPIVERGRNEPGHSGSNPQRSQCKLNANSLCHSRTCIVRRVEFGAFPDDNH